MYKDCLLVVVGGEDIWVMVSRGSRQKAVTSSSGVASPIRLQLQLPTHLNTLVGCAHVVLHFEECYYQKSPPGCRGCFPRFDETSCPQITTSARRHSPELML